MRREVPFHTSGESDSLNSSPSAHSDTLMLADNGLLTPPSFIHHLPSLSLDSDNISMASGSRLSLSINYIPSKFSEFRNRKGESRYVDEPSLPKRGGGLEVFKTTEARMPQGKARLRWNRFKWVLFFTNSILTMWSVAFLIVCLLMWFDIWTHADVVRLANTPELIFSTVAASIGILTSLIGWAGILLNNRSFLAWYTFLTWVTFACLVVPGYITYKRFTFNLQGKVNAQWSRDLHFEGRLRIQNKLSCCGYFSPFIEATVSQTCYSRTTLSGCKGPYLDFQRTLLRIWFTTVFSLVPVQITVMVAGLMCSSHITYRFGKGMMPEAYRLNTDTMAVLVDNYANRLADQYGPDIASDVFRSTASLLGHNTPPDSPNPGSSKFRSSRAL